MIIQETNTNNIVSSGGFKEKSFKIKDAKMVFDIMSSRIYNNKIGAIVREIISNAIDANTEVKNNRKIDIHLPTFEEEWFSVRDFGPGINSERINVFISFGDSTKRDDPNQIGYYGMGSKSPFSYTDSFYITTWCNGYRHEYMAYIDDDKNRKLAVLQKVKSDEPNGTEIKINIKDRSDNGYFKQEFNSIWGFSNYLFNSNIGFSHQFIYHPVNELHNKKDVFFGSMSNNNSSIVVMNGNVAYFLSSTEINSLRRYCENEDIFHNFAKLASWNCVIRCKVGELNLTVSRENIEICEKNATVLASKVKGLVAGISKKVVEMSQVENYNKRCFVFGKYSEYFKFHINRTFRVDNGMKVYELKDRNVVATYNINSCDVYDKYPILYYFEGRLNKIKDRIIKFLNTNNLQKCIVIKFDTLFNYQRFKHSFEIVPIIPLDNIIAEVKKREKVQIEKSVIYQSFRETSRFKQYRKDVTQTEYEDDLKKVCYYIITSFDKIVCESQDYNFKNILGNYPESTFRKFSTDITPIYRVACSVKNYIPKHWIPFEPIFHKEMSGATVDLKFMLYSFHKRFQKSGSMYYHSFPREYCKLLINKIVLQKDSYEDCAYASSFDYNVDQVHYFMMKNKNFRNIIAGYLRRIKKELNYIIVTYPEIFLENYAPMRLLKQKVKTATIAVESYIKSL